MKISISIAAVALGLSVSAAAGTVHVTAPWLREAPSAAKVGAGYGELVNTGRHDDRLLGGTTPAAAHVEVHRMSMDNGIMRMRPVEDGLLVPARGRVVLKPGSFHLMLIGLKQALRRGEVVPVTLRFARAGLVTTGFHVEAVDYQPGSSSDADR